MAIHKDQFRRLVVRYTLKRLHTQIPYSKAAENLLMGTAAQESRLGFYLKQIGKGPAVGPFQMEPRTHNDHWVKYISSRPRLAGILLREFMVQGTADEMIWNLCYATAMARVHYRRVPEALPKADDLPGLAVYWKRYYNTWKGRGTTEEFILNYRRFVGG